MISHDQLLLKAKKLVSVQNTPVQLPKYLQFTDLHPLGRAPSFFIHSSVGEHQKHYIISKNVCQ